MPHHTFSAEHRVGVAGSGLPGHGTDGAGRMGANGLKRLDDILVRDLGLLANALFCVQYKIVYREDAYQASVTIDDREPVYSLLGHGF